MRVVTVINQKGGVGKSTTAGALGAGLSLRGYSVLFLDMDAQGNLSYSMGADTKGRGVLGILEHPETAEEEIQHAPQGDIIASSPMLAAAEKLLKGKSEYQLREALTPLQHLYDFTIIDTPPYLGTLTLNALTASTGAIIPAQADPFSLLGISQIAKTAETVKKFSNPDLRIMGILITRYNGRTIIRREIAETLESTAEQLNTCLYATKIRECTAIVEAQTMKKSIFDYAPRSNGKADYNAFVREFLRKENLDLWAKNHSQLN